MVETNSDGLVALEVNPRGSRKWKCRICGYEVEGTSSSVCPYDHCDLDPYTSLSMTDHHNIDYGKPAV